MIMSIHVEIAATFQMYHQTDDVTAGKWLYSRAMNIFPQNLPSIQVIASVDQSTLPGCKEKSYINNIFSHFRRA